MASEKDTYEIVFSFDTTGSMYSCLEEVRSSLGEIVNHLRNNIPGIRIALFAHGDYCDKASTYVTKYIDFSNNASTLCDFVKTVGATGGGDAPECYELVMREVQEKLSWSPNSQKALVIIGDAPPHEASEEQNYRHLDWREEAVRLRNMGVKIYAVECHGLSTEFYHRISSQTFGYFFQLCDIKGIKELMMKICFREAGLSHLSTGAVAYSTATAIAKTVTPSDKTASIPKMTPLEPTSFVVKAEALQCDMCKVGKLSEEFPPDTLTKECEHPTTICLRCVVTYATEKGRCPHDGCGKEVHPSNMNLKWFKATLDEMFLDYNEVLAENQKKAFSGDKDMLCVSAMNGDTMWIEFKEEMTIQSLKEKVSHHFSVDAKQQRLLFNGLRLKGKDARLRDLSVTKNSTIYLLIPLYCVPEDLNHVVFDLSWDFPESNPDFLDASCFAFKKTEFVQLIDWNHSIEEYYLKNSVKHSEENIRSSGGKKGHQKINVYLKQVPYDITHIYFTLSSWKSPNLSAFSNPSLQFYEASEPDTDLCETTFIHGLKSQAVIMCCLVRHGSQWEIHECKESEALVNGNAKNYEPIRARISKCIAEADED
ncbi:hypothetical protein CHS0354_010777 [Potamilus streckersoni]|uniref:Ubiquitin-like domain-containing protein n=1 Tax=Potamilus streckersoni TaxID=2493646 RepID=A0AAE0T9J3_9BIVA|nr:hypothetical protein CHS0354_010777 [Potamilus streckersoni]